MDYEWVIPTIASSAIGIGIWYSQQRILKDAKERDLCAEAKQQETRFILRMIRCIGNLTYANSIAIQEGKVNGVMSKAISAYDTVSQELDDFLEEQTTARLH